MNTGVIADYSVVYSGSIFEETAVDDAMDQIETEVLTALDNLKNESVGNYTVDDGYIDNEAKTELQSQSKLCIQSCFFKLCCLCIAQCIMFIETKYSFNSHKIMNKIMNQLYNT